MSGIMCARCRRSRADLDGIRSVFIFEGVIREAIHQLKYHNLRAISSCLAEFQAAYLSANSLPGEIVVPVPLHPGKLKQRGYNQSSLLVREICHLTQLPAVEDCLVRVKRSRPQVEASSAEERRENVADAFACRDGRVRGKRVILVDDVRTSGATLESCAGALKREGAISVWGLTLACEI
ncbi:MAG: ComF family protein [Dehalococcoidia bacterium]|nr:ComF family protein [Dehalococcoidia bacterium]